MEGFKAERKRGLWPRLAPTPVSLLPQYSDLHLLDPFRLEEAECVGRQSIGADRNIGAFNKKPSDQLCNSERHHLNRKKSWDRWPKPDRCHPLVRCII